MKQFPIKDVKNTFDYFFESQSLPKFDWGKKLYIHYKDALRAAIPLYSALIGTNDKCQRVVGFNIAGIGNEYLIEGAGYRIFKTPSDYDAYVAGAKKEYEPERVTVADMLRVRGFKMKEHACWYYSVLGWRYEKRKCAPDNAEIKFRDVWLDEDGSHITVLPVGVYSWSGKCYLTRAECIADNTPAVIDFDDEVPVQEFSDYTIPVKLTVKATSMEDAQSKVRDICGSSLTI